MDEYRRGWYDLRFEIDFMKKRGNAFQDFFSDIMERCYPGDFIRTRPWGNVGDQKNDGYLQSQRCLFQVYAPNNLSAKDAIAKIHDDFHGALPYWRVYFDTWIFTHNARDGLGPEVISKLLELTQNHSPLKATPFGYPELLEHVRKLKEEDLVSLFGSCPSMQNTQKLRIKDLQAVLQNIERGAPPNEADIRPVPPEKLAANALSPAVQHYLQLGMIKTDLLRQFFAQWYDPTYGDELADTFRREYEEYKGKGLTPDQIFMELQSFVSGARRGMAEQEEAALTVLAYFFEACDIFERPRYEYLR